MSAALTLEQRIERIEAALGLDPVTVAPCVPWPLRRATVLGEAAKLWNVAVDDLTGKSRIRVLVVPRAAVVMALRASPPMSYSEIGRILCKNHSSIINLERFGSREICRDAVFAGRLNHLKGLATPKAPAVAA